VALATLTGCAPKPQPAAADAQARALGDLSNRALAAQTARLGPGARDLASRHDPALRRPDLWGRPLGWADLDLRKAPDLGIPQDDAQGAVAVNNLRPFSGLPIRPMRPFVLQADADDSARALHCMTQAIYYEAAREPVKGQEAVAQVVLNRVRHPAYPKSICGVVYQGAGLPTGCQFTFTCDGALRFAPQPAFWRRAEDVAKKALAGFVDKEVGSATHYHAAYVAPYWAPTLVKMTQVGQHIFYRWTGPWGEPPAFTGRYAGREAYLSAALLASVDPRTQGLLGGPPAPTERKITLAVAGEVRTYTVVDPPTTPVGVERARMTGAIFAARRQPTAEEIKKINDSLAAAMGEPSGARSATASGRPAASQGGGDQD
jgi:hypothetical protein